jgi:hypothetical protein
MAYAKFDDPTRAVSQAPRKIGDAMPWESFRRAIQSITNRVISGTGGTLGGTAGIGAGWLTTGGTCGLDFTTHLILCVNGMVGTAASHGNIQLPKGTQSKSTYVKYLVAARICSTAGTACQCIAGNEGATSTAAYLPDCPDGYVAIGYMEYVTGTAGAFIRFGGGTAGGANVISGNAGATCGTVGTIRCLVHMPYSEV